MKKLLLLLLTLLLLPMAVSAQEVEIDGIYYRIYNGQAIVISHPDKYSCDIVIPSTVNYGRDYPVVGISESAFEGCSDLQSVTIPSSVTSIGVWAFRWCNSLPSITIPSSVTSIGASAFEGCTSLTSITIPNSVTSIGSGITSGCSSLTSIVVEEGNPQYDSRDNCNAIIDKDENMLIAGCKTTVIPSGVTIIGGSAFWGMPLTSIVIPGSVTLLEDMALAGCSALTDVYCLAENVPSTSPRAFLGSSYESATLYVPANSVEKYKTAERWKDFGNIVSLPMCAKPTIASANGKLTFSCKTEGVEFVASVSPSGKTTYKGSSLLLADLTTTYRVSVYAKKEGFEDSEAATIDVDYLPDLDDVNGDGQISISDVVGIVDIILKGN